MKNAGASTMEPVQAAPAEHGRDAVHLEEQDGIAVLRLAPPPAPGQRSPVVTLTRDRMLSLQEAVETLAGRGDLRGLIVTGPVEEMFAAGADIEAIAHVRNQDEAEALSRTGQQILEALEALPRPKVAALGGPCLGGGLELALALDARVALLHPSTRIGLPEVQLGILPGFGGTVRLPRLVGLPRALDLILTGRALDARKAARLGVVDRLAAPSFLLETARSLLEVLEARGRQGLSRPRRLADRLLSLPGPGRALAVAAARRKVVARTRGHYPAPLRALEVASSGLSMARADALAAEARALGELLAGPVSRRLVQLFLRREQARKLARRLEGGREVHRAVVAGAGVMGGGIAGLMARRGLHVRVADVELEPLRKATAAFASELKTLQARGKLTSAEAEAALSRWTPSTVLCGLSTADLFLEAVVEAPEAKKELLARVFPALPPSAVLATNTSSLRIDLLAEALPDPTRLVGMHFFNPPGRMPLVEVVRGRRTSEAALATAVGLAAALGKVPVVVGDAPGFLVNRCLAPYLEEASRLLVEGVEPEALDRTLVAFGFPMGPALLLDRVGYDVAARVASVLAEAFPDRMGHPALGEAMVQAGLLGSKSGGGLYGPRQEGTAGGGRRPRPHRPGRAVLARLREGMGRVQAEVPPAEMVDRCVLPMVAEAVRCLEEGVVENEEALDLAMVLGVGFPPFRGGPMALGHELGWRAVVERLDDLARRVSPRFTPGDGLRRRAVAEGEH